MKYDDLRRHMTTYIDSRGSDYYFFVKSIDSHSADIAMIVNDRYSGIITTNNYEMTESTWDSFELMSNSVVITSEQALSLFKDIFEEKE
jgi:hypothetical protein